MNKSNNFIGSGIVFLIVLLVFFRVEGFINPIGRTIHEIEDNNFIDAVGIDLIDSKENNWKVSVVFPELKIQNGNKQEQQKNNQILSSKGKTIFDAHRNLHLLTPKNIIYKYAHWIMVGEEAARSSLAKSLDFEIRDYERGWTSNIAVIKDAKAEEFLKAACSSKDTTGKFITGLREKSENLSISDDVTFVDVFSSFDKEGLAFCIPYFTLDGPEAQEKVQVTSETLISGGLAVIKDKKLYSFLDNRQSRGVNWITGNIKSSSIVIKDRYNQDVAIEVLRAHTTVKTSFKKDMPIAEINIELTSQINELQTEKGEISNEYMKKLEQSLEDYVKAEAESVLIYAKESKLDIFGMGDKIYHQHPLKWKTIEDNWDRIFSEMDIKIKVKATLESSGKFKKALGESGEK